MLRLFCQQSCRRCACPISGVVSVPALSLPTGGGGALAVTAAGEPAAGAAGAAAPPTAAATDGASAPAAAATAASPSPAANSSAASPLPAASGTPQQQLVDPLFDALASLAPANGTADGGGGGGGPGGCRTDVLNFLRCGARDDCAGTGRLNAVATTGAERAVCVSKAPCDTRACMHAPLLHWPRHRLFPAPSPSPPVGAPPTCPFTSPSPS